MFDNARAGDDRLSGGEGNDILSGDAVFMFDNEKGGHDTFVFDDAFGNDTVRDFRQGDKKDAPGIQCLRPEQYPEFRDRVGWIDTVITAGTSGHNSHSWASPAVSRTWTSSSSDGRNYKV